MDFSFSMDFGFGFIYSYHLVLGTFPIPRVVTGVLQVSAAWPPLRDAGQLGPPVMGHTQHQVTVTCNRLTGHLLLLTEQVDVFSRKRDEFFRDSLLPGMYSTYGC